MILLPSRALLVCPPIQLAQHSFDIFIDSLSGHKRWKNRLYPPSYEKPAAGCLHTLSSHSWVSTIVPHHISILTFPFPGTAGTTPALLRPPFAATTPFLDHLSTRKALAVAMSHPTEVATGGVWIDPNLLAVGTPLRRSIAVQEATHLLASAPGRTVFTSWARVTSVWRRNFLATQTILLNNTPASISKSTTISLSRLPVPEFQTPLLPSRTPRSTPFSWRIFPALVTTPLPPSKSIRFLS